MTATRHAQYAMPKGRALDTWLDSHRRINLWEGSVRSAKTITSLYRWAEYIRNDCPPVGNLMMAGQTRDTVHRNCVEPLQDMFPGMVAWNGGTSTVHIFGRPAFVLGGGDVRGERRLRGVTLAGAYIDEATLVTQAFWNRTTDRLSLPGAKLFGTTNPDMPTHWLRTHWIRRAGELDMAAFRLTLDDNPWLPDEYKVKLRAEHVGVWFRRYILGLWVAAEGAIWPQLDPAVHVVDHVPDLLWPVVAVDYGTVNPLHALLIGVGNRPDGPPAVYVAREWVWDSKARGEQLTDAEYARRLRKWAAAGFAAPAWQTEAEPHYTNEPRWVVDPSAASMVLQLERDRFSLQGADNTVQLGLRNVSSLLAVDRLYVHRSCTTLIDQATGYSWDEAAALRGEEIPAKVDDHGPDALRYGIQALHRQWRDWLANAA